IGVNFVLAFCTAFLYSTFQEGTAMNNSCAVLGDDWSILVRFLPDGWRDKAKELGALQRFRAFPDVDALLRTLLDHVAKGSSLRGTAVRAALWGCASVSDVAIWKRLKRAGDWLRWMAEGVMERWVQRSCWEPLGADLRLRVVDGTTVQEPGSKGISWRLHYSIDLPSLMCTEVHLTRVKVGESFKRFAVQQGDVLMGDRGFAHASGIAHTLLSGGHVIVRVNLTNVRFQDAAGRQFPLLDRLRTLSSCQIGDWDVWVPYQRALFPGRICALKLSDAAQEKSVRKTQRKNGKKGTVKPETLEAARYVMVFTTLDRSIAAETILDCYAARWQIELVFKRLKSLLHLGHLRKKDTQSARAWIHAKLLLAFLIEAIRRAARDFFPWGYPLGRGTH
ncbi:MAG: IS4 family transposase, partial [Chloroflexota bacterium]